MLIQILHVSTTPGDVQVTGADHISRLVELAGKRQTRVVGCTADNPASYKLDDAVFDGLVVIGDYNSNAIVEDSSAAAPLDMLENLTELLQTIERPVLALGFGFELLCEAYGIHLPDYGERGPGAEKMEPTTEGTKLFQGSDPLCISKGERWRTDEFPKKLQVLARSKTGVEAVKHKTKPLYGLQQRPEDFIYFSDAKIVYENIFSAFDKSL